MSHKHDVLAISKTLSPKMSVRQQLLISGYLRGITTMPELQQIVIGYYLLYGEAFMWKAVNVLGAGESYFIASSPQLFGADNVPFTVSFDIRFIHRSTRNEWPHNIGFHGGLYLGLQSDTKQVDRWNDHNPRTIIDWADHMAWIREQRGGYRLYRNHGANDHLKSNPQYTVESGSTSLLRSFCTHENDGAYATWKITYNTDGKAVFTVNNQIIFTFVPLSYDGFIGFWQYNHTGVSIKNLVISMIV
eukprot:1017662_1